MTKRPRLRLPPCIPHIELKFGIEWKAPTVTTRDKVRLKQQAARIVQIIADDCINAAKERFAEIGRLIAVDAVDQARRDRQEADQRAAQADAAARLADLADSILIAGRIL